MASGQAVKSAFIQKAGACRTAALTLGAPRIEQLVADALAALEPGEPGADRALGQALYWLARVAARHA